MKIPYTKNTTFTSFDKTVSITTLHQKPDRTRMLEESITTFQIPRGSGLSYVPASFGQDTLVRELSPFNRILEFDVKQKTVVVESGITLKKLLEWSFTEKLYLPVQPGYPDITIGGCVAANVHGKNPHKYGSFKEHVIWIELFHPKNGSRILESKSELFEATFGGLGLTGIITKVKIQLRDLPSDRITVEPRKVDSMIESAEIFERNPNSEILYAWHNGSILKNFEKGVVQIGSFSEGFLGNNLIVPKKTTIKKIQIPISFWGKFTIPLFNSINRNIETSQNKIEKDIFNNFFPFTFSTQWYFVLYGKKGFRECQILVSKNNIRDFIHDLTSLIRKEKPDLHLMGLKPFRGEQKFLQYCRDGLSITLNFKNSPSTSHFLSKIDELVMSYKALPYIIKDSRLPKNIVEKCYPQYEEFKNLLKKIDPDRIFKSYLSEQLNL
ncbi:MAG: FAD-binding oxidoreductase [Thaumarchaeota archaeon]|nr:FAD-binding oxidoreductase [Nitrososphaerota archaeon]